MRLAIIQARLTSSRFPGKVLEMINGYPMWRHVEMAAHHAYLVNETVMAWAHKFKDLDENDVLGRFRSIVSLKKPDVVVRLTSDCPLLTGEIIDEAIKDFMLSSSLYYCNRDKQRDGYDVQVFAPEILWNEAWCDKEHVIKKEFVPNADEHYGSVDTRDDLEKVRNLMKEVKNG